MRSISLLCQKVNNEDTQQLLYLFPLLPGLIQGHTQAQNTCTPQQYGLMTSWCKHTCSRSHISTFSKKSCRNSKVGLYKSLIIVMCEYLRIFNRFIFRIFQWTRITPCFLVSFITVIYFCIFVRDTSRTSENRNTPGVQAAAWALELFKRRPQNRLMF